MIDLSYFIQLSGNNSVFLMKVMNIFVNETPSDIQELETSFTETDYKKVKELSHKLKGLFKSYNMVSLVENTIELESHAKSEVFSERSKELLIKVKTEYFFARSEMMELIKKYSQSSPK